MGADYGESPGQCDEGLRCDSQDTLTCVPSPYWPKVSVGGECTHYEFCEDDSYCRPQQGDEVSEESPGICTVRTPEGQSCELLYECTTRCLDGTCEVLPPALCDVLESWWASQELVPAFAEGTGDG